MPRINLEDSIFTDGRFKVFSQGKTQEYAIGCLIMAWKLAQTYWIPERKLIPHKVFHGLEYGKNLVDSDLAEDHENGVYIRGTKEQFEWLLQKISASKKGGESNAKRIKKSKENSLKIAENEPENSRNEAGINPAEAGGEPSLLSSLYSSLSTQEEIYMSFGAMCEGIKNVWNERAKTLHIAQITVLSKKRKDKIKDAIVSVPDLKDWVKLINRVGTNFELGLGEDGWRANFDWLFRNDNFLKKLEEAKSYESEASSCDPGTNNGDEKEEGDNNNLKQFLVSQGSQRFTPGGT